MMMNKSTLRLAATVMAVACASAAHGQQPEAERADSPRAVIDGRAYPETRLVAATEPGAPPEAAATQEQPVEPVRLAQTTPAPSAAQPARLPDMGRWSPLLVLFGLLTVVGAILLMTRRRMRRAPWESDDTEASTARGRQERFAEELRALWDKTATTEVLRPRDEPKTGNAVPK